MKFRLDLALLVVTLIAVTSLPAQGSGDGARTEGIEFNIPRQRADQALIAFAEQADLTLVFPFDEARRQTASDLLGRHTVEAGLMRLLSGTSLSVSTGRDGSLSVRASNHRDLNGETEVDRQQSSRFTQLAALLFAGFAGSIGSSASAAATESLPSLRPIEEIVVTARKREERVQDVPVAVTAFSREEIARYQLHGVDELAAFTPGLLANESSVSGGGSIYLRGIGNGESNYLADQAVAINVDGMQVGSLNFRKNAQIDLAQIEILRGPQALFFGKNSPGGVLSFRTADPADFFEAALGAGIESVSGDRYVQGLLSGPINDRVSGRIVARYTDLNGYFNLKTVDAPDNPFVVPPSISGWPSGEEYFVRATLLADITERLDARLKLTYNKSDIKGGSMTLFQRVSCPFGAPQGQPDFPCKANRDIFIGGAPADIIALVPEAPTDDGLGLRENEQILATMELDFALTDEITLTSLTGVYDFEEMNAHNATVGPQAYLLVPFLPFDLRQYTQELRLTSDSAGPVNFMVGGFVEHKKTAATQGALIPFIPLRLLNESARQKQVAASAFGQIMWSPRDDLELSAGVRYSHEKKDLKFFFDGMDVTDNLVDDSLSYTNWSPELTVAWRPMEELMLFTSYKRGFKSGGFDAGFSGGAVAMPGYQNTFEEEKVSGFEGGAKVTLGNDLAFNLIAYWYDYDDLQVGSFDSSTLTFRVLNAAEATVRGLEADFDWRTNVPGLRVRGSAAYNRARFEDFLTSCYVGQTIALGCNQTPNPNTGVFLEQDLSGRQLDHAPKRTATLGFIYEHVFANLFIVDLAVDVAYTSGYFANQEQAPQDFQSSFTKVNGGLRLHTLDERWEFGLAARNITNKFTFNQTGPVNFTGSGSGTPDAVLGDRRAVTTRGRELLFNITWRPGL